MVVADQVMEQVGVLGAGGAVGDALLRRLAGSGRRVTVFSRRPVAGVPAGVEWRRLAVDRGSGGAASDVEAPSAIALWICIAPIWVVEGYRALFESYGAQRIVALSSTSRFVKGDSKDRAERDTAQRIAEGEERLTRWASGRGVEWVILRPTLVYGGGRDRNVAEIARFVRRFGFFPLLGEASGLRQPVHVEDVASACVAALGSAAPHNRFYTLSGGETLAYREMVARICRATGRSARTPRVPLWVFRLGVRGLRLLPRYRGWTPEMAERMNRDLVFGHEEAARDLGFRPRAFRPTPADVGG